MGSATISASDLAGAINAQPGDGLVLDNVSAGYNNVPALRDVSAEVFPGERIAILGPNGVGKTTLIRAITGLVRLSSGSVTWEGRRLDGLPPHAHVRHGVATVPEGRRIYGGMSVEENLLMGGYSVGRRELRDRVEQMYDLFPLLRTRRRQAAGSMSGGEQQVCAIARALMSSPRLLLIDELSMGLSPAAIKVVIEALQGVIERFGLTLIVVDQDINTAAALATRGYFVNFGSIVAGGPIENLMEVDLIRNLYFRMNKT